MRELYILLGIVLAILGIRILRKTRAKKNHSVSNDPPPLPPRTGAVPTPRPARRTDERGGASTGTRALPPRMSSASATADAASRGGTNLGPRGEAPIKFPCCPYDRERNVPGKPQKIFWDGNAGCYLCSRGHRFQRNGRIF